MPRHNLTQAMQKASGRLDASEKDDTESPTTTADKPSRIGKKMIAGYFDPAVSRQIRQLALDDETTVQALLGEALNDLFAKRGKPPIA